MVNSPSLAILGVLDLRSDVSVVVVVSCDHVPIDHQGLGGEDIFKCFLSTEMRQDVKRLDSQPFLAFNLSLQNILSCLTHSADHSRELYVKGPLTCVITDLKPGVLHIFHTIEIKVVS